MADENDQNLEVDPLLLDGENDAIGEGDTEREPVEGEIVEGELIEGEFQVQSDWESALDSIDTSIAAVDVSTNYRRKR